METAHKPAASALGSGPSPATLAKGALRRLTQAQQEPTPENYARAYAEEAGLAPPPTAAASATAMAEAKAQANAWAPLVERLAKNLERGGRQWTAARRKDSLQRVFGSSRSDAQRLQQRLQSLMTAWESDQPSDNADLGIEAPAADADVVPTPTALASSPVPASATATADGDTTNWPPLVATLHGAVQAGLHDPRLPQALVAAELAAELAKLADAVAAEGATPAHAAAIDALCQQARRWFAHRHHLIDALSALCRELTGGLTDLAEDDSWVRGQCVNLQTTLEDEALSVRGVRAASALLADTRQHHQRVRTQRQEAREALRHLIQDLLAQVGELGDHAGRFQAATAQHAQAIEKADTLDSLAHVVKAMLEDARTVQAAVGQSQERLHADRDRATALESQVRALEADLRRLSEEVSTDALTQVANRRGLMQAFDAERSRVGDELDPGAASATLSVGLIDIDNFKRLNDSLGHAAGDVALQRLAATVRERLRPIDHIARFGGEEFVVLLPSTAPDEAQQVLTRLQRSLTEALFLHDGREVFVTFSAGVSAWRPGEALQATLERADAALYEAKRAGKNRTFLG